MVVVILNNNEVYVVVYQTLSRNDTEHLKIDLYKM